MTQNNKPNNSEIIFYTTPQGDLKVDVLVQDETVWLTQKMLAELFQTTPQNITLHLRNIYAEGELEEQATCKDFLQVQKEGGRKVTRTQKFYNLDAIISVGYRVKSKVATQFRISAMKMVKENNKVAAIHELPFIIRRMSWNSQF